LRWPDVGATARDVVWSVAAWVRRVHQVVFVGLEGAGKTTALLRLRYGQYGQATPTLAFNTEKVRSGGASWVVWDVGGAERLRPLWRSYTRGCDALVFVVDACSDPDRLEEAKLELHRVVKMHAPRPGASAAPSPRPPLLVLANKQDLPGARPPDQLAPLLALTELPPGVEWAIAPSCSVTGEGLAEAMACLATLLQKRGAKGRG